jgi:hypothetical protein
MKTKMGRPKLPRTERKGAQFAVRLNKEDADKVYDAIDRSELSQPDWLRRALLVAAET